MFSEDLSELDNSRSAKPWTTDYLSSMIHITQISIYAVCMIEYIYLLCSQLQISPSPPSLCVCVCVCVCVCREVVQDLTEEYIASTRADYISRGSAKVGFLDRFMHCGIVNLWPFIYTHLGRRSSKTMIQNNVHCFIQYYTIALYRLCPNGHCACASD